MPTPKTVTLTLTREEYMKIDAMLTICTATGGGSPELCLHMKVSKQAAEQGVTLDHDECVHYYQRYSNQVVEDWKEHSGEFEG